MSCNGPLLLYCRCERTKVTRKSSCCREFSVSHKYDLLFIVMVKQVMVIFVAALARRGFCDKLSEPRCHAPSLQGTYVDLERPQILYVPGLAYRESSVRISLRLVQLETAVSLYCPGQIHASASIHSLDIELLLTSKEYVSGLLRIWRRCCRPGDVFPSLAMCDVGPVRSWTAT